jgi:putative PIN family toxin of toxin-antitoxin system
MRVVIDTNVLVSAALRDRLPEDVILHVVGHPEFEWIVTPIILAEYRAVLARPKLGLPPEVLERWMQLISASTVTLDPGDIGIAFPRDQKDAPFLIGAIVAEADCFVTGDRDFTEARKLVRTTILSVSQFKQLVIDQGY